MEKIKEILKSLEWIEFKDEIQEFINNNDLSKKDIKLLSSYGFTF